MLQNPNFPGFRPGPRWVVVSCTVVQLNIQMSYGSATTDLRWGARLFNSFFHSSSQNGS